ncbi:putative transcriptional regulator YheO [Clostridium tetanomorphum]|uniref:helix-turn-helix transcriptional regulator n=1 Tax=Clostridium tetanomorphum TaxID=1553 RepID=UPI00044D36E0|nr:PAS domain-containing protein [Clostridium tetanomorphum]KAJ49958.1 YheO domain-containing protein [Clostridium tetanomorphum DSM 665]MBP1866088.1 putative transcriptional regulator YheO [Clostridium tetanomorphum]NRS86716.1 putative transcriptional regulator YheO [Clostridium tetanomorphum]SQC00495.1 YheO domain-containing protein [Clostridium tetanomorphum]
MNDEQILAMYIPIVNFIGDALGASCEVVLHDTRNASNSVIAIKNNNVSGRKIGSPLTDLALKKLKDEKKNPEQYITKYSGKTKDGKILNSSTYFIRNNDNKIIGMLCINIDVTKLINFKNLFNELTNELIGEGKEDFIEEQNKESENFTESIEELVMSIIENTLLEVDIPPERMSPDEKMNVVHSLNEKGVFLIKGAIGDVAKQLKTSENTIYRYLNKKD